MAGATSRGPRRSRSSRSLSLVVSSFSLALFASPCFLRPCFYPDLSSTALSLSRFLAPLPFSLPVPILSLSFPLVLSTAVYSAVNGQAWSTDPRMACSCLLTPRPPRHPLSTAFLSSVSLPFRTDLPFSLSLTASAFSSPRSHCVFFATLHTLRGKGGREEGGRTGNEGETRDREREREGHGGTTTASYVLGIRAE